MANNTHTCIHCDSTYNTNQKQEIYIKLGREIVTPLTIYNDTCLACSVDLLNAEANKSLLILNKAVMKLRIFERLYKKFREAKQKIEARYHAFDQQHNYIKFFLHEEAAAKQAALTNTVKTMRKKRVSKIPSANKQADLISSLLASLTPEQRAAIAKQAADMK